MRATPKCSLGSAALQRCVQRQASRKKPGFSPAAHCPPCDLGLKPRLLEDRLTRA